MSLLFTASSSQYAEATSAALSAYPFTIGAYAKFAAAGVSQTLVALSNSASDSNYHALITSSANKLLCRTNAEDATGTTTLVSGGPWYACMGVWASATDRSAYVDAGGVGTDTTSATVTGLNRTAIGRTSKLTPANYLTAHVAKVAIWNVALGQKEREEYAAGLDPRYIKPQNLVYYTEIFDDSLTDIAGGLALTKVNSPVLSYNPPLFLSQHTNISATGFDLLGVNKVTSIVTLTGVASPSGSIFSRAVTSPVTFYQSAATRQKPVSASTTVTFTSVTTPAASIYSRASTQLLSLSGEVRTSVSATASSIITFTSTTFKRNETTGTITFSGVATAVKSKVVTSTLTLSGVATRTIISSLATSSSITFTGAATGYLISGCNLDEYDPVGFGPTITFGAAANIQLSGVGSLTLRNPEFGNSEAINVDRSYHSSRGGTQIVFRDSTWPATVEFSVTVRALTRVQALAVLTFINNNLGLSVTYTDQDARSHSVIIMPEASGISDNGQLCNYTANLSLVGAL